MKGLLLWSAAAAAVVVVAIAVICVGLFGLLACNGWRLPPLAPSALPPDGAP